MVSTFPQYRGHPIGRTFSNVLPMMPGPDVSAGHDVGTMRDRRKARCIHPGGAYGAFAKGIYVRCPDWHYRPIEQVVVPKSIRDDKDNIHDKPPSFLVEHRMWVLLIILFSN
jgi:hypothetical protein